MRVKITIKKHGIEKLVFGKRYGIAYVGCNLFEEFRFTRNKKVELCEYDDNDKKISSRWISKNELKETVNGPFIHWIGKCDEDYF